MPIIRRTRVCTAAYGVLHWQCWLWLCGAGTHTARVPAPHNHSQHYQCRTPYAAVHTLVLLMMAIMMPETCWDKSLLINIRLVGSCWFLSLHPTERRVWVLCSPFLCHGCSRRGKARQKSNLTSQLLSTPYVCNECVCWRLLQLRRSIAGCPGL